MENDTTYAEVQAGLDSDLAKSRMRLRLPRIRSSSGSSRTQRTPLPFVLISFTGPHTRLPRRKLQQVTSSLDVTPNFVPGLFVAGLPKVRKSLLPVKCRI